MARRGGLVSALHRAAREADRAIAAAAREAERAQKEAERARRAEVRAAQQRQRKFAADSKRAAKEAKEAHIQSMQDEVASLNAELNEKYERIDSILMATLSVDDYVDIESLRQEVQHPPFDRADLEEPGEPPKPQSLPAEPILYLPPEPKGLAKLFGGSRYLRKVQLAEDEHKKEHVYWLSQKEKINAQNHAAQQQYHEQENERIKTLEAERARYQRECHEREKAVAENNAAVDQLINDLGYGVTEAVHEYIGMVLSNSNYPPDFSVTYRFRFEPQSAELILDVTVPNADVIPTIKSYKYVQKSDEITSTPLSQKACRDRYAGAVHQVALRTFHEVFEADRRGIIQTIALKVGTQALDRATGQQTYIPFVAASAERNKFLEINLAGVVPAATLEHLGAAISKNPMDLLSVDATGIRKA